MNRFCILIAALFFMGTTIAQTSNPQQYKYVFSVAKDGTGDYAFIQDAIDAMRVYPLAPITLYLKNGVYHEKIELPANNVDVTFIGESVDGVIILYDDYSGKGKHTTFTSYTAKISGNRFRAENITFANAAGTVGQALALYVDADKAVFKNCRFLGNQDTIFATGEQSRQLFEDCFIEGTTDFIFGPSTAVFKNCTIRAKSNSYITAANTTMGKKFGFVFLDCQITADASVTKVFLGRPWRAHSKTVLLRCDLPEQIAPEGWDNWNNPENEKTVFYAEYQNTGEGAAAARRVGWSKQLKAKEAKQYTPENIFNGSAKGAERDDLWFKNRTALTFDDTAFKREQPAAIPLYDGVVPNSKNTPNLESAVVGDDQVTRISKVSQPTLTIYKPEKPNGQAVIICPGGGYAILAFDKEGTRVAEELNRWGVTALVLKYRLPDDAANVDKSLAPWQDAQQAIRYARQHAKALGIKENKIGIMGFSAGGHVAATASTHFEEQADPAGDTTSVRPDFSILVYPVVSFDSQITHKGSRNNLIGENASAAKATFFSNELHVKSNTPPAFLVHASDDQAVPVENSIRYYQACVANKVPAALHVYPAGGHGFGMYNKTTSDSWMERLRQWLDGLK